jgi:hypothetical protein
MKTATVALLGLGSVLSGVLAAPTPRGAVERVRSPNPHKTCKHTNIGMYSAPATTS